ncbi:MAG: hypothetical protein AAFX08_10045 [Pseudomonadota bacterium]
MLKQLLAVVTVLSFSPALAEEPADDPATAAMTAYRLGDHETARRLSSQRCVRNVADGCALYGDLLRQGLGGSQSLTRAANAYDRGCRTGRDGRACAALGALHNRGVDGVPDLAKAQDAYQRACDLDSTAGCAGLGNLLFTGLFGAPERREGLALLRATCADGYEWSCERVEALGQSRRP